MEVADMYRNIMELCRSSEQNRKKFSSVRRHWKLNHIYKQESKSKHEVIVSQSHAHRETPCGPEKGRERRARRKTLAN